MRLDVLSYNPVKTRGREICVYNGAISLKFDRRIGSDAAEGLLKFQSDAIIQSCILAASRFHEILC